MGTVEGKRKEEGRNASSLEQELQLLPYSPDLFVKRAESDLIFHKIMEFLSKKTTVVDWEEPFSRRTIIVKAEPGAGATWLLRHLAHETERKSDAGVYFLTIQPDLSVGWTIADFMEKVPDLKNKLAKPARTDEKLGKPLVLFVDQNYEADGALLSEIEKHLLRPLAIDPSVLIVMAGSRDRAYDGHTWIMPELRLFALGIELPPFSEEQTADQIAKQAPDAIGRASEIHQLSGGNPYANYILAKGGSLSDVIDHYMGKVILNPEERERARQYVEALSVLPAFVEELIPPILAAYYNDPAYLNWRTPQKSSVRHLLLSNNLMCWKRNGGGFVINPQIRHLAQKYLETEYPDRWADLHLAAYNQYRDWMDQFPRSRWREHFETQANYHAKLLLAKGVYPPG